MPTLKNAVPKYRKHRASGQAVVTICGKEHYLGPYGTKASTAEYDRLIGEWLASGRPTTIAAPSSQTIAEVCLAYSRHAEPYYGKGGALESIKSAIRHLRQRYAETLAADFGPLALKAVRQQFVEAGYSRKYVNRLVDNLRRMFKWAVAEQLVEPSVYQALMAVDALRAGRTKAHETEPVRPVTDDVVEATLPFLPPTVAAMVRIQRLTGMRPAEVCGLRPKEVDRTAEVWRYEPAKHKTAYRGKSRVVFIGPQGQEALLPYLLRDAEAYCFSPAETVAALRIERHSKRQTPMSCGNVPGSNRVRHKPRRAPGEFYDVHAYRRAIHRACDLADAAARNASSDAQDGSRIIPRWSPNRLRHTAATEIRRQFGLEAAQVALGHSQANVTELYAERDLAKAAAIMKEVG